MKRLDFLRATLLAPLLAMLPKDGRDPTKRFTNGVPDWEIASWKAARGVHTMDEMREMDASHPDWMSGDTDRAALVAYKRETTYFSYLNGDTWTLWPMP